MRIALIGPAFTHGLTYQENLWAEHLTRMGHVVRVFCAARKPGSLQRMSESYGSFEVQSVETRFLPRSTYKSAALLPAVREFDPQLIVVHGDKLFAKDVVDDSQLRPVPMMATFSENVGMHEYDWRKPGISLRQRLWAIGFRIVRAGPIRAICRRAVMLIGNSPQARGILTSLFNRRERPSIDAKILIGTHGFSPQVFSFRPEVRRAVRAQLGVADSEVLVCVTSHFDAAKAPYVIMIIDALRAVMSQRKDVKALVVGFQNSPTTAGPSQQIAEHVSRGPHADRFIRHDFADKARLSELYNASDIAAFGRTSISMHEALGTGLIGCFANDGAMSHIVKRPEQAEFYRPADRDDLAAKLISASVEFVKHAAGKHHEFRQHLADESRWLGYDRIIASYLAELESRLATAK